MIIKETPTFQLRASLTRHREKLSLELHQTWPRALRPHSRRILQVLLTPDEAKAFGLQLVDSAVLASLAQQTEETPCPTI